MSPHEAADKLMTLSEEQSRLIEEATVLEEKETLFFVSERKNFDSDKACSMSFKGSVDGLQLNRVSNRIKAIRSELSTLKSFLRHKENEARNLY